MFTQQIKYKLKYILVIIILIITGGILCWQLGNQGEQKTFSNKEYKFEIKYPKSWYNFKGKDFTNAAFFSTISLEEFKNFTGEGKYGFVVIDYIKQESVKKTEEEQNTNDPIDAYLKAFESGAQKAESRGIWKDASTEKIEIGGMNGGKIYFITEEQALAKGIRKERIYITYYVLDKNSNGILEIKGEFYGENTERYIADFNQMLSTFKFLD